MSDRLFFSLVYLAAVFVSSVSQVLLKRSANAEHGGRWREYFNVRVVAAYGLFFLATLITVTALRYIPVSLGTVLESTGYLYVTVLGIVFLKEKVSGRKWLGLAVIVAGILIYSIP